MFAFRPAMWVVAGVFLVAGVAPAADPAKVLIDQLPDVDRQDTGYSGGDSGTAFLPLNRTEGGPVLLSPRQGTFGPSDAMRSLVKLGVKAVPALLDHLSDDRKTKIELSHPGGFGGMFIEQDKGEKAEEEIKGELGTGKKYTVRVGDLCYVALGQIVNRDYTAVRYIPTAIVGVTCVPKFRKLREELVREWGGLTADRHRDSLVKDLDTDRDDIRTGAPVRLGYYYPDALEAAVLKQLARPAYDGNAVEDFLGDKLYPAKTAMERKELVDGYVKAHGEVARDGIRWLLFNDLDWQIADEEGRMHPPSGDRRPKARECLVDVFGYTGQVTLKDRPKNHPPSVWGQRELIDSLRYDRSEKIDRAVRDILAKTGDRDLGRACLNRLVGRGCDADIEAYLKRLVALKQTDPEFVAAYTARFGWTWLHRAVELDVPDLIETALKDKVDVNAKAKDGRTPLHVAAAEGSIGAVRQLLAANADKKAKDANGRTPLDLAKQGKHTAVVNRLGGGK
ncbi:MAG: ankyrin repeat domain-containing protein, partial [Gemmataceae bacterium]